MSRSRIDWKYLLGLSLSDPGFDASVLSEFRGRLVKGGAESLLFDRLLVLCREQGGVDQGSAVPKAWWMVHGGFLARHGRQRMDSTHVIGAVRTLTRLPCAIETLRAALDALAVAAPDRLRTHADKAWADRCERRGGDVHIPKGEAARRARRLRASWISRSCWTPSAARSSAGRWPTTCAPSSCSTRSRWRSDSAGRAG